MDIQSWFDDVDWEAIQTRIVAFIPNILLAAAILIGFWIGYRATRRPLTAVLRRARLHEALVRLLVENVYRFTILIFGLVMALSQLGVNVTAALTGIGIAGIAVGFAAQDSLANVIAGFLIFLDKPFLVGDWISVADKYGKVSEITLRTTRIRTRLNTYVVIPNKKIIDEVLVNHSKHGETRVDVPVGIAYKENVPRAREVLLAAVSDLPDVMEDPAPSVVVKELGASSVDLLVRVWISDAERERPVFFAVIEASKLALDAAGIEIPYHHLQLFIEQVEDRVWEKAARLPGLVAANGGDGNGDGSAGAGADAG